MIDVTYEFYQTSYGGCLIPEGDWKRTVRKAESYLASILHRTPAENQAELVQLALCESAELAWQDEKQRSEHGGRQVKSESTDGYSVTYAADGGSSDGDGDFLARRIYACLRRYLGHTGLLYAGVDTYADKRGDCYL